MVLLLICGLQDNSFHLRQLTADEKAVSYLKIITYILGDLA